MGVHAVEQTGPQERQQPATSFVGAGQRRNHDASPEASAGASLGSVPASASPTDAATRLLTISAARAKSRKSHLLSETSSSSSSGTYPAGRFDP